VTLKSVSLALLLLAVWLILLGLGFWQLDRLAQKEALIALRQARLAAPPSTVSSLLLNAETPDDFDYWPVSATGRYDHDSEFHLFATRHGQPGWQIITPMALPDGVRIFVDRGFVPEDQKKAKDRKIDLSTIPITITGVTRLMSSAPPDRYIPANQPADNIYYWLDFAAVSARLAPAISTTHPLLVIADPASSVPAGPQGRTITSQQKNDHLSYAVTWFGLALALMVIIGLKWRSRFTA
jgi:surfeit locus 1 family protein